MSFLLIKQLASLDKNCFYSLIISLSNAKLIHSSELFTSVLVLFIHVTGLDTSRPARKPEAQLPREIRQAEDRLLCVLSTPSSLFVGNSDFKFWALRSMSVKTTVRQ